MVCDGRRVEPGDLIDIFLDAEKFPLFEDSPIRAVVLDVRATVPPESVLGAAALDVQVADADLPAGVFTLDPDDIDYVKCVDCCIRNSERIDDLETEIDGAHETIASPLSPFIPEQFVLLDSEGDAIATFVYGGLLGGFPFWESAGAVHRIRRIGNDWIYVSPSQTYTQLGGPVDYPWVLPTEVGWSYQVGLSNLIANFGYTNGVYQTNPILPSSYSPYINNDGLVFLKDENGTVWYYHNATWLPIVSYVDWNVTTTATPPSQKIGVIFRVTVGGTYSGQTAYVGDLFIRLSPTLVRRLSNQGQFDATAVTIAGVQTITGNKTFTGDVDFTGAANFIQIEATSINVANTAVIGTVDEIPGSLILVGVPDTYSISIGGGDAFNPLTSNQFVSFPDASGYVSIVASPTGRPAISEVSGIRFGQLTLVAGTASVAISGSTTATPVTATARTSGTGLITASCAAGTLTITSSDNTDTRVVSYIVIA